MSKPKPISITMNHFEGELPDAKAIRFVQATLDSFLLGDDMAQIRVLQYCQQKLHDKIIEAPKMERATLKGDNDAQGSM